METKKLEILLKTVKIGSMKKASEELNYTQSGLIYTMNSLEEELGIRLLVRSPKGVLLTTEGHQLMPFIQNIIENQNLLQEKIDYLNGQKKYTLRIGAYPIFARYYLPEIVSNYMNDFHDHDVEIKVGTQKELAELIDNVDIDLAIGEELSNENCDFMHIMDDEVYVAVPEDFHVTDTPDEPVLFSDLNKYPMVFSDLNPVSHLMEEQLSESGAFASVPKINVSSPDGSVLLSIVAMKTGIAFLSGLYLAACPEDVQMLKLSPTVVRKLGVITRSDKAISKSVKNFIPYLEGLK